MKVRHVFTVTFVVSLGVHALVIGFPIFSPPPPEEVERRPQVFEVEVERETYIPKIKVMGKKRRLKKRKDTHRRSDESSSLLSQKVIDETRRGYEDSQPVVDVSDLFKEEMLRYQDMVKQKIEEAKRYPYWARRAKIEGTVLLSFRVLEDGEVEDIKVLRTSGFRLLDEEAVNTIMRASPFPPLPEEIKSFSVDMEVSIIFIMK